MLAGTVHVEIYSPLGLLWKNNVPLHLIIGDIVNCLAGSHTIATADAPREIDGHMPLVSTGFTTMTTFFAVDSLHRLGREWTRNHHLADCRDSKGCSADLDCISSAQWSFPVQLWLVRFLFRGPGE
jgi:hypothetical protein